MSSNAPSTPPADRYGRAHRGGIGRGARVAIAAAIGAAVALAAWFALALSLIHI